MPKSRKSSPVDWRAIKGLWANQTDALELLDNYFASAPDGAALMQMPTGSGKTAIIAVAARARTDRTRKLVLVLSPSAPLCEQLRFDLACGVWSRLGLSSPWSDVDVTQLLRKNRPKLRGALAKAATRSQMFVGTLQALNDIRVNEPALYAQLQSSASAVFVDEGHREPALQWSRSVESLGAPIVLFSATPYRNDLRVFRINESFVVHRSFGWAVRSRLIRDVRFEQLDVAPDAGTFAVEAARRLAKMEKDGRIPVGAKAILRFANRDAIRAAVTALNKDENAKELGFVAVHERFENDEAPTLQQIPDLRARSERMFLHQFKLSEGLDEPRCSVLFLHSDFSNERQLVQQIGRCVRRLSPGASVVVNDPDAFAVVVTLSNSSAARSWAAYRAFDTLSERTGGVKILNETEYGRMLRSLDFPTEYAGRKFRLPVPREIDDLTLPEDDARRCAAELRLTQDVLVPRRCVIYESDSQRSFEQELLAVERELEEGGRNLIASAQPYPDSLPTLHVFVCHVVEPSEHFDRFTLLENSYTATIVYVLGERVFLYDSARLAMTSEPRVGPDNLRRLLPERPTTRITMTATKNTDISRHATRSRMTSAASMRDTPAAMTDFLGVLSRTSGSIEDNLMRIRRYIGFFNARVTDGRATNVDVREFAKWCGSIASDMDAVHEPATVFDRYARPIAPPSPMEAYNILLDPAQLGESFYPPGSTDELLIEDYCADLKPVKHGNSWTFSVGVVPRDAREGLKTVECTLAYEDTQRFRIECDELALYASLEEKPVTAIEAFNRAQAFRIIVGPGTSAYGYGQFYSVEPSLAALREVTGDLLVTDPTFAAIHSEKGDTLSPGTEWDADSLFGMFAAGGCALPLRQLLPGAWDAVICDDLNSELADFVCYRLSPPAIALIHAKRPPKAHVLSASSLHDVLAQAVKNLDWIRVGGSGIPKAQLGKWNRKWRLNNRVVTRIRHGASDAKTHLDNIEKLLRSASTQRHVCIAIAGGLNRTALLTELAKSKPDVVAVQAFLLLMAFYAEASSIGVTPTVLCD